MSPTIVREQGYSIIIFPNDHAPAHVHVRAAGDVARVQLEPLQLLDAYGYNNRQVRANIELVEKHRDQLLRTWDAIHPERR